MIGDDLVFDIGWQLQYGPGKYHYSAITFDLCGPCCPVLCGRPDSECTCLEMGREMKKRWILAKESS